MPGFDWFATCFPGRRSDRTVVEVTIQFTVRDPYSFPQHVAETQRDLGEQPAEDGHGDVVLVGQLAGLDVALEPGEGAEPPEGREGVDLGVLLERRVTRDRVVHGPVKKGTRSVSRFARERNFSEVERLLEFRKVQFLKEYFLP